MGHDDPLRAGAQPGVDLGEADRRPVGMAVATMRRGLDGPPKGDADRRRPVGRGEGDQLAGDQRALIEHDLLRSTVVDGDGDRFDAPHVAQPGGLEHRDMVDASRGA